MLFSRFVADIERHKLLHRGASITVGVSGGADSVCLLHLLFRLRPSWDLKIVCAHLNHNLRKEASADADFVQSLCEKWEIPFLLHSVDIQKEAKEKKTSLENAGREARYAFFQSICSDYILTAHTKNDAVETVFLHMIRGCALSGLSGIAPKQPNGIVRPLLGFEREEIEAYLHEKNIPYQEDMTNLDITFTRNRIRHAILPQIAEINPSYLNTIYRMTDILKEEDAYMQAQADALNAVHREDDDVFIIHKDKLYNAPLPLKRRIVYGITHSFNDVNKVLDLLDKETGKTANLTGQFFATVEYNQIVIYKNKINQMLPVPIPQNGDVQFGPYTISVGKGDLILKKANYVVRARKDGDVFSPEGMQGTKKLKCYLIDKKIPKRLRDELPIFVCDEKIAAVGNLRRDKHFVPQNGEENIKIQIKKTKT